MLACVECKKANRTQYKSSNIAIVIDVTHNCSIVMYFRSTSVVS